MAPQKQTEESNHREECSDHPHHYRYVCVHCGCGCQALYRQMTPSSSKSSFSPSSKPTKSSFSMSSLKAVSCKYCHQSNVDPFMEREVLLVVVDWILLRPEAYRHVLFNIIDFDERHEKDGHVFGADSSSSSIVRRKLSKYHLLQFCTISCVLLAYLKWDAVLSEEGSIGDSNHHGGQRGDGSIDSWKLQLSSIFVVLSALELAVQYMSVYGYLSIQRQLQNEQQQQQQDNSIKLSFQILWALILPTMIHIVTLCVLTVWENNSQTVRIISSILVICWQWLGLSVLLLLPPLSLTRSEKNKTNDRVTKSNFSTGHPYIAPVVGMISLIFWRCFVANMILIDENYVVGFLTPNGSSNIVSPCLGLQLDDIIAAFSSLTDTFIFGDRHGDIIKLDAWSVPNLCLT